MPSPKRVWVVAYEGSSLLSIDGFQARVYNSDSHLAKRFLSMFPKIPMTKSNLYDLNFITGAGEEVAILHLTINRLHSALLDLSSNHGLELDAVEGLQEIFPDGFPTIEEGRG